MNAQPGPSRDPDERALRALFDETAEQASGPVLTKLRARAVDVPFAARRRWRAFWFVAPGLAAGLTALLIAVGPSFRRAPHLHAPSATAVDTAPVQTAAAASIANALNSARATPATSAALAAADELGSLGDLADDSSDATGNGLSFDPLYAPAPDDDVNAWLYATKTVLQGGI